MKLSLRRTDEPDYRPVPPMFDEFSVGGEALVEASRNYHDATLGWMMGLGWYRQIRMDLSHAVKLLSVDSGATRNRARGHRREDIYTVAVRLNLGGDGGHATTSQIMPILSSDFDKWARHGVVIS